jgi:mannan endo-1,4-beta-mannosidase
MHQEFVEGFDDTTPLYNINVDGPPPPTVDLKINGLGGVTLYANNPATLSWTTTNDPTSCSASSVTAGGWSGAKPSASGPIHTFDVSGYTTTTGLKTFNISCVKAGVTVADTVNLNVIIQPVDCANYQVLGTNRLIGCAFSWDDSFPFVASPSPTSSPQWILRASAPSGPVYTGSATASLANFDWGTGVPAGLPLGDRFMMQWQGRFNMGAGNWRFNLGSASGARLYVDGNLIIDSWADHAIYTTVLVDRNLTAGNHDLVLIYYDNAGEAKVNLSFALAAITAVSVTPDDGTGAAQVFSNLYRDTLGGDDITRAWIVLTKTGGIGPDDPAYIPPAPNQFINNRDACFVIWHQSTNKLVLVSDDGQFGVAPDLTPGEVRTVENGRCILNGAFSTVTPVGNDLIINVALTFKPTFVGLHKIYLLANNGPGSGGPPDVSSGLPTSLKGTYTVVFPPDIPTDPSVSNSGVGIKCEQVEISWTDNSTDEDGFRIYRQNSSGGPKVLVDPIGPVGVNIPTSNKAGIGGSYSFLDVPVPVTATYNYWVVAYKNIGGEAPAPLDNSNRANNSPIGVIKCAATLAKSDKEVVAIDGAAVNPAPASCNNTTNSSTLAYKEKQILTLQIAICNDGTATATNITITDQMINLQKPPGGPNAWDVRINGSSLTLSGSNPPPASHYTLVGSSPNQQLIANLGNHEVFPGGASYLTFKAQLPVIISNSTSGPRWQNAVRIDFTPNPGDPADFRKFTTPLIRYISGRNDPNIIETD